VENIMPKNKEILNELYNAVVSGDIQKSREISEKIVQGGFSTNAALEKMREAMRIVDEKYEKKEYFIVDVASSASAMREAFKILEPHLTVESAEIVGKVVIGSLKGNIQGLGKDIVAATLRAAGLQVIDVGVDIHPEVFVDTAIREKAQIIGISISVEETIPFLKNLVNLLQQRKLTDTIKTVIGGQAVSEQTCRQYGIDAYAKDAWDCVKKVKQLLTNI
jgi:5-methyltetrahydrofolate--homocysteine methyltransferase